MAGHQIKSAEPRILANGLMLITFGLKQEIIVWENERGLLYRDGRYEKLLQPGRYDFWRSEKIRVARAGIRPMSEQTTVKASLTPDLYYLLLTLSHHSHLPI